MSSLFHHGAPSWAVELQHNVLEAIQIATKEIMSTVNTSAANLQAGEAQIETDLAALGTAISSEITDVQAEIATDLQAAGVPQSVVDGVTAKLTAVDTTIKSLTSKVAAADPGTAAPPVAPPASS
jgi:hypothetical protein